MARIDGIDMKMVVCWWQTPRPVKKAPHFIAATLLEERASRAQ